MDSPTDQHQRVTRHPFQFAIPPDEVIRGDAWVPDAPEEGPAIVVCHGFKGFKDWGFFPYVSEELAARTGIVTVSFNFTGSGVGGGLHEFDELDRFAHNTFTRELSDLEAVLDRLSAGRIAKADVPPPYAFGLLGHSRGGATCVLKAALRTEVQALVTWSSIASVERYEADYVATWEAGETVFIPNVRTGQQMPLHRNVLDDIRANRERLDVLAAAASLDIPYLAIHGSEDESVPAAESKALVSAAGTDADLLLVEGAGHTLNAVHPFEGTNELLELAVERSAALFHAVLPRN
jgi:pimeloyl-ACP methyl ester carboxylesterase